MGNSFLNRSYEKDNDDFDLKSNKHSLTFTKTFKIDPFQKILLGSLATLFEINHNMFSEFQKEVSSIKFENSSGKHIAANTDIISEGDFITGLYIIDSGKVMIKNNKKVEELDIGDHFGFCSFNSKEVLSDITAMTLTDCRLLYIDNKDLIKVDKVHKDLSSIFADEMDDSIDGKAEIIIKNKKHVHFDTTVKVVLMATKEEYKLWGVKDDIWYKDSDYLKFRYYNNFTILN